ncbi:MAG: DUF4139 domain-containing protein [Pseudomonadota bacterium]
MSALKSSLKSAGLAALVLAAGQTVQAEEDLAITFYSGNADPSYYNAYNNGFAVIFDKRDIAFDTGENTVVWPGVSSAIDPATVTFNANKVGIIEQNFDFDLLTPGKMLEKSVGKTVDIIRHNRTTGEDERKTVKVLSVNEGIVIEVDGEIEVLREGGYGVRFIYDEVPENLRARPTLSVKVNSAEASTREAQLTYLSGGLGWRGDYVAVFDESAGSMDLQGWATITNTTSTTYENASLSLAAGEVSASSSQESWNSRQRRFENRRNNSRVRGGRQATGEERIGDNYVYTMPFKTTVASNQTKQVSLIDADAVKAERIYEYVARGFYTENDPLNADVKIAFSNSREGGLAAALPAGTFRVYTRDSAGRAQFIGEDLIPNSPGGTDLAVKIGQAFDITVEQRAINEKRATNTRYEVTMRYIITNAKSEAASVRIKQPIWRSWWDETVEAETHPHEKQSRSDQLSWTVDVPAEGETTLEFTVVYTRPY